jgi:hypothetical protein
MTQTPISKLTGAGEGPEPGLAMLTYVPGR